MTEPTNKEYREAVHRLTPLLTKAGLSEEKHGEFIDGVNSFTTMMTVLLEANHDTAPNFITFALYMPKDERYELTIRKCEGKTPSDLIDGLENRLKLIGEALSDADASIPVVDEGIRNMSLEEAQDAVLDLLLQIRDIQGEAQSDE